MINGDDPVFCKKGLTKREYFAIQATCAIISKSPWDNIPRDQEDDCYENAARGGLDYADALLKVIKESEE